MSEVFLQGAMNLGIPPDVKSHKHRGEYAISISGFFPVVAYISGMHLYHCFQTKCKYRYFHSWVHLSIFWCRALLWGLNNTATILTCAYIHTRFTSDGAAWVVFLCQWCISWRPQVKFPSLFWSRGPRLFLWSTVSEARSQQESHLMPKHQRSSLFGLTPHTEPEQTEHVFFFFFSRGVHWWVVRLSGSSYSDQNTPWARDRLFTRFLRCGDSWESHTLTAVHCEDDEFLYYLQLTTAGHQEHQCAFHHLRVVPVHFLSLLLRLLQRWLLLFPAASMSKLLEEHNLQFARVLPSSLTLKCLQTAPHSSSSE